MDTGVRDFSDPPRLLDRVRDKIRLKHYSIRTEQAYVDWIKRFIVFHGKRHPQSLGAAEVEAFLTSLAVERQVAAATQNLAKSALLFLYRDVLEQELPWLDNVVRARTPTRLPVVLTRAEVDAILRRLARRAPPDRPDAVWHGHADHGMRSIAREGRRVHAA